MVVSGELVAAGFGEEFRMKIRSLLRCGFNFFHLDAVGVCPCVMAYPCDLPRHFAIGASAGDFEAITRDFSCNEYRSEASDGSQLIAEVHIEGFKPVGH